MTALVLPDGRYAVVVSETRPGDVFVSKSMDGPWEHLGSIQVDANGFDARNGRMSNVSIMVRPDGAFEIVPQPIAGSMVDQSARIRRIWETLTKPQGSFSQSMTRTLSQGSW